MSRKNVVYLLNAIIVKGLRLYCLPTNVVQFNELSYLKKSDYVYCLSMVLDAAKGKHRERKRTRGKSEVCSIEMQCKDGRCDIFHRGNTNNVLFIVKALTILRI